VQYFQHATLIPALESFAVAHVENYRCLLSKSLIACEGNVTHSKQLIRCGCLNEVVYKEKITVQFETNLFTKKINGIILGHMTRPVVYPNLQYIVAHDTIQP
jgi:hypothetical protein